MEFNPKTKIIVFITALVIFALGAIVTDLYVDWMWFKSLALQQVFITTLFSKVLLRIVVVLGFFVVFLLNFIAARKTLVELIHKVSPEKVIRLQKPFWEKFIEGRGLIVLFSLISLLLAFIFSAFASDNWMVVQQYLHAGSFGIVDPLYGQDIGFMF